MLWKIKCQICETEFKVEHYSENAQCPKCQRKYDFGDNIGEQEVLVLSELDIKYLRFLDKVIEERNQER